MNLTFTGVISATLLGGIILVHESSKDPEERSANVASIGQVTRDTGEHVHLVGSDEPGMWKSFEDLHEHYTQAFVNSESFGISRVLTFDSPENRTFPVNGRKCRVHDAQLIGFNGDVPRVYESSFTNPTRSMLATSAQRPLTDFEKQAIRRLKTGTDYVLSGDGRKPENAHGTLVAALRASQSGMACHDAKRGQLLGAFAYRLDAALPNMNIAPSVADTGDLLTSLEAKHD